MRAIARCTTSQVGRQRVLRFGRRRDVDIRGEVRTKTGRPLVVILKGQGSVTLSDG